MTTVVRVNGCVQVKHQPLAQTRKIVAQYTADEIGETLSLSWGLMTVSVTSEEIQKAIDVARFIQKHYE